MAAPFMMKHHLARERRQDVEDEGEAVLCRWQLCAVKWHAPLRVEGSSLSPVLLQPLITSGQVSSQESPLDLWGQHLAPVMQTKIVQSPPASEILWKRSRENSC